MLASISYLLATIRGLSLLVTHSLRSGCGGVREFGPFLASYCAIIVQYYTIYEEVLAAVCKNKTTSHQI
jgi:hypothetical protein